MIERILMENGLTDKETKVYLAALELGEATVSQIAAKTRLKRTTVYDVMESLLAKRTVSVTKRRGVQYLSALPPRALIERFKSAAAHAESLLPQLMDLAYSSPLKPRMRFYEGIDGVKEVLRDMSFSTGHTFGFGDYSGMPREIFRFIQTVIVPERRNRKNFVQLILPKNRPNVLVQSEDVLHFREHRLVEFPDQLGLGIEILLYDKSKVGVLSFKDDERFGVIIDSSTMYHILRNLFLLVWNQAKAK